MSLPSSLLDKVTDSCLKLYNELPKSGKPIQNEWTVLSCIVQLNTQNETYSVVSLGTGSKCIGASKMSPIGNMLNDSHAEVIARRGFLKYLYANISNTYENKQSIFIQDKEKFRLKDNIQFIFYSSQMPCGDASIIPKGGEDDDYGTLLLSLKREAGSDICDVVSKKIKVDIHRTGAKCLSDSEQDLKMPGKDYHLLGKVRTKPGRGDQTLSVSCSDKIAKWIHLGIQGSLLDMLLCEPIFIKYFIIGAGVPYSEITLKRALLVRESEVPLQNRVELIPEFYNSSEMFPHVRQNHNAKPAAGSIIWVNSQGRILEVAVQGKKLGVTKKKVNSLSSCLCICKYSLYKNFLEVLLRNKDLKHKIGGNELITEIPYNAMKKKALRYQQKWQKIKDTFFQSWTSKPDIWNFCISDL